MVEYDGKNVIIMSCSKCNCNCKHCYISYHGCINPNMLNEMVLKLSNRYTIMLNGTEPILNIDYLQSYNLNNQDYLLTNGLAIYNNYDLIDELKKNNINRISISYHYGIHDDISQISTDIIKKTVDLLLTNGFNVRLLCTISSKNYDKVLEFCDVCHSMGVNAVKFTNYIRQGNALQLDNSNILNYKELIYFFKELEMARKKYSKEELLIQRCGSFGPDITKYEDLHFKCLAGIDNVVITPSMDVYRCIFLINDENKIGYYEDGHIWLYEKEIRDDKYCLAKDECNKQFVKRRG